MRIALISTPFVAVPPAGYGGTELVVAELVSGFIDRGHQVTLYATGDSVTAAPLRARYEKPIWPPDPVCELAHVAYSIHDLLGGQPVDVIHAHVPSVLAFARLLDIPVVYTIHHAPEPVLSDFYRELASSNVTMVAISERQKALHAADFPSVVVYHGIDAARYPAGAGAGGYAAFLGRFSDEKGVHTAIDVAREARVRIRLGGRWHKKDARYFETEVKPRLAHNGVEWVGELDHAPKVALLGNALATLFPIDWEEPFGLVMIESMFCGTPVLAFRRGSAPEVVDDGVTGWLCSDPDDMADRLRALAERPELIDRTRCRAHAIERFGAGRMVEDYLRIYRAVAGRPVVAATDLAARP